MAATFDRDDPRGLGHALTGVLRQRIIEGDLAPGALLPSESALSEEFGVSRTVVREATAALRAAGLVETFQGRGSFVLGQPVTSPVLVGNDSAPPWLQVRGAHDVLAMMDMRLGLEPQSAALAAQRRTPAQLASIRRALATFAGLEGERVHLIEADFAFHARIAEASGNRYIASVLKAVGPRAILAHRAGMQGDALVTDDEHFARLVHEHTAVAEAIERSDAEGAAAAMTAHLRRSRARIAPPGPA
ncbi:MAG: FadR/GntR family transcriptional regulator [Propioniciclava sp.]|uniref:FadR/GntR family transcriptional regulator n=1 Tax=Propioniciclava sp. TaxID=2038686 RepID=UPI0039E476FF